MLTGPAVFVHRPPGEDRIEITLRPGFTQKELDVVRGLPGRRYDARRRTWVASNAPEAIKTLTNAFGAGGVMVTAGEGVPRLPDDPAERAEAYILQLIQLQGISRSYQNQLVSALRFLCESVLGKPKLALKIPRPRKERRLPAVLSQGEVSRFLRKPRNPKHRAILMLLYSAGLRVGEVVRLKPSDLDMERGLVHVSRGKGRRDRYTLLARRAAEAVGIYRDAYPTDRWLFPGDRPDRHLTTRSVQRIVKNAAAAAGIEKNVTAHTLRHSFATHLLESGTNLRIIQELLGNQSARTTQIYTHVAQSTIEAVRSPLDDLD